MTIVVRQAGTPVLSAGSPGVADNATFTELKPASVLGYQEVYPTAQPPIQSEYDFIRWN